MGLGFELKTTVYLIPARDGYSTSIWMTWMKNVGDDQTLIDLGLHKVRDAASNRSPWRLMPSYITARS